MIPDCGGRSDGRTIRQTESIMAKTALCKASYADALSKIHTAKGFTRINLAIQLDSFNINFQIHKLFQYFKLA